MTDMGLNSLEVKDGKQAADTFEKCLKEFPNSRHRPEWTLNLANRIWWSSAGGTTAGTTGGEFDGGARMGFIEVLN